MLRHLRPTSSVTLSLNPPKTLIAGLCLGPVVAAATAGVAPREAGRRRKQQRRREVELHDLRA